MSDPRPIGVFDSGVGGLTVLREIVRRLPHESTVYLGDNARTPYGPRPDDEVRRFSFECLDVLAARDVKAIVVACNTASSVALPDLRRRYDLPILGVVRPGAHKAASATAHRGESASSPRPRPSARTRTSTRSRRRTRRWRSTSTRRRRSCRSSRRGPSPGPEAEAAVADAVAPLVGRRAADGEFIHPMPPEARIDTLLLGCTHYPLLQSIIAASVGESILVVDSASSTAWALEELVTVNGLEAPGTTRGTAADAGRGGHDPTGEEARTATHIQLTTGDVRAFHDLAARLFGDAFPDVGAVAVGSGT